ncbi:MAG: PD40 domain-containing protein [Acidobacteria bacterium]|nr:PD40 domain-containing protein [Acidobacteriota bacterium]
MSRRSAWFRGFHLLALLIPLCAAQLLAQDGKREAAGIIPPDAAYFGQNPPGERPERFAPGILSAAPFLERLAFSPDGKECFFTVGTADYSANSLFLTRYENGAWTPQAPAPFTAGFERSGEPFFSPDGKRLYFTAQAKDSGSRMDIWMVDRTAQGWGTPIRLPSPINSNANEFCFSRVQDGTMYFLSNRSGAPQVYRAREQPDQSLQAELVPAPVLSIGTFEGDPCVAPDGRFLVFYSGRAGGFGAVDLYASFPDGRGGWTSPVNLGPGFNTEAEEFGATLSPDGKCLFFVRHSMQKGEIYWVSTTAIDNVRPAPAGTANTSTAAVTVDSPTHAYPINGKPSAVVQDHEAMLALALQVEKDLKADLSKYDIQDKSVLQRIYSGLYGIAMLKRDYAEARRYLGLVQGLQENPVARLMTGVITGPYMEAMERPGADFHATFRALLSKCLAALPYQDVQGTLNAMKEGLEAASKAQMIGGLEAGLDPAVKDGQLSQEMAGGLVSAAMNLEVILPVKEDVVASIKGWFEANKSLQATVNPATNAPPTVLGTIKPKLKGAYFGQTLPGETPVPFAPEILNALSPWVAATAFSPDGTHFFVSVGTADWSGAKLYYSKLVNGEWTPVVEPAFLSDFTYSNEPLFSPDGTTLTFTGKKATGSLDLWTVSHRHEGWGTPVALPSAINSDLSEYRGSYLPDGTLYFTSGRSGVLQMYKGYKDAAQTLVVDPVGAPISTYSNEGDPCIASDGRFLIFCSARDRKSSDLYVSFSDGKGGWAQAIKLGDGFNTPAEEYGAHLSSDGKCLFFTRHDSKGNGIYWVATSAIDKLK